MQGIIQQYQGRSWFPSIDLASGFFQLSIAEEDRHKTAFRDALGQLWEYMRCGFGLKILPPAFAKYGITIVERLARKGSRTLPGRHSYLHQIL